jgi:hypothetical protein
MLQGFIFATAASGEKVGQSPIQDAVPCTKTLLEKL